MKISPRHHLLILTLALLPQLLLAWGANGHRIVAKICYDNLTPEVRQRVDNALGDDYLTHVSNWPDYIKSERGWNFANPWHYTTVQPDETLQEVSKNYGNDPVTNDVREGIEWMLEILAGDSDAIERFEALMEKNRVEPLSGSVDATALAFLIHFIGDIHQPMHVGKNRDLGGNKIAVQYFGDRKNLHAVWDTDIIEHERLSYTEFSDYVSIHTRNRKAEWEDDGIETWIAESIELRERIYNTLYDETDRETGLPDFGYGYQHDFLPLVEERLGAAGYRAAWLLNNTLG